MRNVTHERAPRNGMGARAGRGRQDALIERLHRQQEAEGWLSPEALRSLAVELDLPPSRVFGVASFYHFFRLTPPGARHCTVCTGTSCHIMGGSRLLRELEARLGIPCGTTAPDGSLSLERVHCLGRCQLAPLAVIDDRELPATTADEVCRALGAGETPEESP